MAYIAPKSLEQSGCNCIDEDILGKMDSQEGWADWK